MMNNLLGANADKKKKKKENKRTSIKYNNTRTDGYYVLLHKYKWAGRPAARHYDVATIHALPGLWRFFYLFFFIIIITSARALVG